MTDDWRLPTDTEAAKMVEEAYGMGLDGDYYDEESRSIQWDDLLNFFEGSVFADGFDQVTLGDEYDSPLIKAIQKAYRKGRKDQVT